MTCFPEASRRGKQAKFETGQEKPVAPKSITVSALVESYIAAHAFTWRPRTKVGCETIGKHLVAAVGRDLRVADFGASSVKRVLDFLEAPCTINGHPRSKQTVRKCLTRISAIFDWAAANEQYFIRHNPFKTQTVAKKRRVKTQRERIRVYTPTEIDAILGECPSLWWRAFVLLALRSGLRLNELAHLHWSDLDLTQDKGRVRVAAKRPGSFVIEGRTYPVLDFEAKAHVERSIPIANEVVELLRRLRAQTKSPYVFLTLDRLATIDGRRKAGTLRAIFDPINNVLRAFKSMQRRAFVGLDGDHPIGTVHDCRRTYCTVMADVVPPHRLRVLAGHANIETTLRFYLNVDDAWDDRIRSAGAGGQSDAQVTRKPESGDLVAA